MTLITKRSLNQTPRPRSLARYTRAQLSVLSRRTSYLHQFTQITFFMIYTGVWLPAYYGLRTQLYVHVIEMISHKVNLD